MWTTLNSLDDLEDPMSKTARNPVYATTRKIPTVRVWAGKNRYAGLDDATVWSLTIGDAVPLMHVDTLAFMSNPMNSMVAQLSAEEHAFVCAAVERHRAQVIADAQAYRARRRTADLD